MIGLYVLLAGLNGMTMILMAAYGAHGLSGTDAERQALFQTGWQIHAIHCLFLAMIGLYACHSRWLHGAFWFGLAGTVFFCVPLYGAALGWWSGGGPVTPVGGLFLLSAWFSLMPAGISRIRSRSRIAPDPEAACGYHEATALTRLRNR